MKIRIKYKKLSLNPVKWSVIAVDPKGQESFLEKSVTKPDGEIVDHGSALAKRYGHEVTGHEFDITAVT